MEAGSRRESGSTEDLTPSGLVSNLSRCHPTLIQLLGLNSPYTQVSMTGKYYTIQGRIKKHMDAEQ